MIFVLHTVFTVDSGVSSITLTSVSWFTSDVKAITVHTGARLTEIDS